MVGWTENAAYRISRNITYKFDWHPFTFKSVMSVSEFPRNEAFLWPIYKFNIINVVSDFLELQSVTIIVTLTHTPLLSYSMLVESLLGHSWPSLPGIAFPDLAEYWTRRWAVSGYLWTSLTLSKNFLMKI